MPKLTLAEAREIFADFTSMCKVSDPREVAALDDDLNAAIGRHTRLRKWLDEYLKSVSLRKM